MGRGGGGGHTLRLICFIGHVGVDGGGDAGVAIAGPTPRVDLAVADASTGQLMRQLKVIQSSKPHKHKLKKIFNDNTIKWKTKK